MEKFILTCYCIPQAKTQLKQNTLMVKSLFSTLERDLLHPISEVLKKHPFKSFSPPFPSTALPQTSRSGQMPLTVSGASTHLKSMWKWAGPGMEIMGPVAFHVFGPLILPLPFSYVYNFSFFQIHQPFFFCLCCQHRKCGNYLLEHGSPQGTGPSVLHLVHPAHLGPGCGSPGSLVSLLPHHH